MKKSNLYIAHVHQDQNGSWEEHLLKDHLTKVAELCRQFADAFGNGDWAYLAGLWHDLGKYRPAFQKHIKNKSGYDPEAHIEKHHDPRTHHASTGAVYAVRELGSMGVIIAYLIAGHHAGLPDFLHDEAKGRPLNDILKNDENLLKEALEQDIPENILGGIPPESKSKGDDKVLHMWIRILFSCLTDADFLDTEAFMNPEKSKARSISVTNQQLLRYFNDHMDSLQASSESSYVNEIRSRILKNSRKCASNPPGIYTMTVPTGGGKTLSSLAFALEHANTHDKSRIIYAIPYTSIIEQTANIFREVFSDLSEIVLEHHSNMEPDHDNKENHITRLATENWDMPLVVTTTVQLFDSLYAARTSRCRKLHNLVNSIIILDEVQLLPADQLNPIRHAIELLSEHYGVTFVLSTATPTSLSNQKNPLGKVLLQGLKSTEIIDNPSQYYQHLQRVDFSLPTDFEQSKSWTDIAQELEDRDSVLAIVNTRKDARELFELMPDGTFHLSALMCAKHRSRVIKTVKERLQKNTPTRVISTQVVEAGVDFDFPVVYRALAGLDSIVQAAGRCNREGTLKQGEVIVFIPPSKPPQGLLATATHTARSLLTGFIGDIQSPHTFIDYFDRLFQNIRQHDKNRILDLLQKGADKGDIPFRTVAQKFQMIDDDSIGVFVPYWENDEEKKKILSLFGLLKQGRIDRWIMRELQPYSVRIYQYQKDAMLKRKEIKEITPGFYAIGDSGIYNSNLGLIVTEQQLTSSQSVL